MAWIIISIFFLTLGELCVSPIGLSIMAKVAPDLIKNQIMGLWLQVRLEILLQDL